MYVSQSMLAEFTSPFLNFLTNGGGSAEQQRQFYIFISSALLQDIPESVYFGSNREEENGSPFFKLTYPNSDSFIS